MVQLVLVNHCEILPHFSLEMNDSLNKPGKTVLFIGSDLEMNEYFDLILVNECLNDVNC